MSRPKQKKRKPREFWIVTDGRLHNGCVPWLYTNRREAEEKADMYRKIHGECDLARVREVPK